MQERTVSSWNIVRYLRRMDRFPPPIDLWPARGQGWVCPMGQRAPPEGEKPGQWHRQVSHCWRQWGYTVSTKPSSKGKNQRWGLTSAIAVALKFKFLFWLLASDMGARQDVSHFNFCRLGRIVGPSTGPSTVDALVTFRVYRIPNVIFVVKARWNELLYILHWNHFDYRCWKNIRQR